MNLLLYHGHEVLDGLLVLPPGDRRLVHILEVLRLRGGDGLRAGRWQGPAAWARLCGDPQPDRPLSLELVEEGSSPPPSRALSRILILALPRPPALRRMLELAPQLGLGRLLLIRSARVEKSYFHSPLLSQGEWRRHLELGMEQAQCTQAPEVLLFDRFRPFIEDAMDALVPREALRLLPHPGSGPGLADLRDRVAGQTWCAAVGPEGGWVPAEVEQFADRGFTVLDLGPRILKVEAAVQRLCGQLDLLNDLHGRECA